MLFLKTASLLGQPFSPPHIVHTIAQHSVTPSPPVIAIYATSYVLWQSRVKAKEGVAYCRVKGQLVLQPHEVKVIVIESLVAEEEGVGMYTILFCVKAFEHESRL